MNFEELGLDQDLKEELEREKITQPTKVQECVIPMILQNQNLVVQSETGSGKTLAYLLPLCMQMQPYERGMQVLVLVPTHELAMQVHRQVQELGKQGKIGVKSTTIVGDVNINRQIENLREKPQIVIGTPGRVLELIKKKKITAHTMKTIIIDEADKLLDKNNVETTKAIIKCCMRDTKICMFSATIPPQTIAMAKEIRTDSKVIQMTNEAEVPKNIQHIYLVVEAREKLETMRKLAKIINPKKAMVFINRSFDIEKTVDKLQYHKFRCAALSGENEKQERKKVMQDFGKGELQFLVASDLAARGLHFEEVSTVFHLSIPEEPMDYLHRAGRAGRGQEKGLSVLILTKEELPRVKLYQKAFGINILAKKMYQGKIVKA